MGIYLYKREECNRASAHATGGGERGERGGESSYYNLHYHLEAFSFVHFFGCFWFNI